MPLGASTTPTPTDGFPVGTVRISSLVISRSQASRFTSSAQYRHSTSRAQWKQKWQQLEVPLSSQATFTWTLLPESRDLHPDEPVGGNITLQPMEIPFTVEAHFTTGEDQKGKPLMIKIENVRCLKNGEKAS